MANDDKQNRSLLLCQLINDRQIDKEVGAEIRKLLIEGVDINIRDLNRNNNTPLHLAAQKSDKNCVRLLIKYKPDLQIRNGKGKTPLDVAQSDAVKKLLSSARFDVVEKKFVREIEFPNLSVEWLKCLKADPAFKAIKITRCPNAHIVWDKLSQDDFKDAINNSSYLFFIAIKSQEDEIKKLRAPSADIKRPIIVQITSSVSKESSIYYKEEDSKKLIEVQFHSPIGSDDFLKKIHLETFCNFVSLVQALNSNVFGTFSGSLLDVKLNNDGKRSEIVSCFAKSDALCHRFFKLFDEIITEEELNARATSALLFPGDQSLLALLDLPFDFKDETLLNIEQKKLLSFADSRSYNLLMLAIECNNRDAVKTLLRFPNDLDNLASDNRWASDLCWNNQHWESLAELVEADSPYPENFDASLEPSIYFDKIKSAMEAAAAFHENIKSGDFEAVKQFIKNNPKLKHVYDRSNKSALTTALECDQAEITSLLLSEGFTPGVDVEYDEAFKNCSVKYEIMKENREYFKNAFDEPHLKRLLNKYKLSFSSTLNRETCSKIIQNLFLTLNEIPEMVPILQIVSCSEHLKIVFDFDCHSVHEMDPTVGTSSTGLTYRISGFIYIGAKNHREDFFEVIGTLAHELTHYAMELTYENNCKPYAINDEANQKIFESVVGETRKLVQEDPSTDSIIRTVFTCYPQERWHQELIVRVPHLLAKYKEAPEAFDEASHKNYLLFDFFRSKVLSDIESKTKVLMHKLEIRKINSLTGMLEKIKKHELQIKRCEIKLEDQIFGSNAPQLTLGMLRQSLDESSHVFINIEQISYGNIRDRIAKLDEKDFAIVVDCSEMVQKHAETICNAKEILGTGTILLVMAEEETSIVAPTLTNFKKTHERHNWSDLAEESQDDLLQKIVNFQGTSCTLIELTNKNSAALLELPLKEFCNSENFEIGEPLQDPFHKFYQTRNFVTRISKNVTKCDQHHIDPGTNEVATKSNSRPQIEMRKLKAERRNHEEIIESEKFETVEKTLNEILLESKSSTVVMISDSAGIGKTSTLNEIARRLKENEPITRWTLLTDLKQHIEMFKEIRGDFKSFQDFVTNIILTDKPIFDKNLFEQFHQEGRTNILLDGVDEISPHYKNEVLKALKLFTPKSSNKLWITTRSHLELELEKTLDQLSCSLQPFARKDQIEFLEKVWKTETKSSAVSSQENLAIIAEGLVDKLSSICDSKSSFIGLPISISIVAEVYGDPVKRNTIQPESLSFYSIFKQFVDKKIDISIKNGQIANLEWKEILMQSEGIVEVHRRIAIAHFFGNEIADVDVEYDDEEWTVEKLTRFGLIRYDESKGSLSFIHETFAEYFLTDFIVGNLRTKTSAVKILVKVLTSKDFQVVRLFLDQAVKELNFIGNKKLCEIVGKQLNVMKKEALRVLLHISKESCEEVFNFMLLTIEQVEKRIRLIHERDQYENNVLLISIANNSKTMIQTLFDFITQIENLQISKEMLQHRNLSKMNVFHKATYNKHEEILSTLHECMQKLLTTDEIKKMWREKDQGERNILHCAARFCNENALNDLMEILKKLFSGEEVKAMFAEVNKGGANSLHVAAQVSNKIAIKSFFTHLNVFLNREETKKLIQLRGSKQRNIFHSACRNKNDKTFTTLHESMKPILKTDEIKEMLGAKNQKKWNLLHYAAQFCNENALNDLMEILKKLFSNEEVKAMLFEANQYGNHSLHVAAGLSNKIALKSYFNHVNIILNREDTRKLVQQRGFQQGNIFQSACHNENEEIFSTLHECIQPILSTDEIMKMLSAKDQDEWNVLHSATAFCKENSLDDLVEILKELFSDEEAKAMLFEVNKEGSNSLHVAAQVSNKIALKSFLKHLNVILKPQERKKLILQRGFQQRNIFQSACSNENEKIFSTLHECMQPILTTDEIKKMMKAKDQNEWNVLHSATAFCKENSLDDLVEILKELFSDEEAKAMLFEVNKEGSNSLHVAAQVSNKIALKSFFKHLNVILKPQERKKLIQQRGFDLRNIFHSACRNKNEEIFSTLHECMQPILKTDEIKKMLRAKDQDECNDLHYAAAFCNESALDDLMKILKELFSDEEVKAMLFEVSENGDHSLHVAAQRSNKIALKFFLKHLNVILNNEEIKKLILQRGFQQRNIFHFACSNENEKIFSTLHECTQPILKTDEIKKMLSAKDQDEWNVLHSATAFCKESALNDLVEILKELFSDEEVKAMLFEVNKDGDHSLHVAVRLSNKIALKFFLKHLNVILNNEEIKKLILQRGFQQRNIFHFACSNKNEEIFSSLYESIQPILTRYEIKEMLNQRDIAGLSILQLAESFEVNENAINDLGKIMIRAATRRWKE